MEIKSFGKRKTLMKRIKEIKVKHEKEVEEKRKVEKGVNRDHVRALLDEKEFNGEDECEVKK